MGELFWPHPQPPFSLSWNLSYLNFIFSSPILDANTVCRNMASYLFLDLDRLER